MKILLITYLQRETEREKDTERERGGEGLYEEVAPCRLGKVYGKWANTGLLGALDARLDDSAAASAGISYAELTVVTSQLFDMRAAHVYSYIESCIYTICILHYYIYVRTLSATPCVCYANRSKGASC